MTPRITETVSNLVDIISRAMQHLDKCLRLLLDFLARAEVVSRKEGEVILWPINQHRNLREA